MVPPPKSNIHDKGQYFTSNAFLKQCVRDLVLNNPDCVLEPSIGRGDLIDSLCSVFNEVHFDMYEIDLEIEMLSCVNAEHLTYGDFLVQKIDRKYKTIVGNPPYVKTTTGNLYLDFVRRCHGLLEPGGELIFIVPSDFMKLTSAAPLLSHMMTTGTFTHVIRPNDEGLFEHASIDVIVFRYCLDPQLDRTVLYNDELKRLIETNGIITFAPLDAPIGTEKIGDYFDVFVGMVSGREGVFKNAEFGTMDVRNGNDRLDKYILVDEFPTEDAALNAYLIKHKADLIERKIRRFSESNWFEWGALRNYTKISAHLGEDCLYMRTLTRDTEVAFVEKVSYFGGGILALIPKADAPHKLDMSKVAAYLNSAQFRENYTYSGRFKIGQRQLYNCLITGGVIDI
jgi:adenine-specific DNA-methyltransferase